MAPAKTGKESNYSQAVTKTDQTNKGNFSKVILNHMGLFFPLNWIPVVSGI